MSRVELSYIPSIESRINALLIISVFLNAMPRLFNQYSIEYSLFTVVSFLIASYMVATKDWTTGSLSKQDLNTDINIPFFSKLYQFSFNIGSLLIDTQSNPKNFNVLYIPP